MAYCGKCGAKFRKDTKFCPKCGQPVTGTETNNVQNPITSNSYPNENNSTELLSNWQKVLLVLSSIFVIASFYYYVMNFDIGRGILNLVLFMVLLLVAFFIVVVLLPNKHYPSLIELEVLRKESFNEDPYSEAFMEDVASYKKKVTIIVLFVSVCVFMFTSPVLTFSEENQKHEQVEAIESNSSENQLTNKQSMKDELAAFVGNYSFSCYIGDTNAKMFFQLSLKSDGTFSFKPGNESTKELMNIGKVIDGLDYPDGGKWKVEDSSLGRYALLEFDCSWGDGTISPDKSVIQINNMNGTTLKTQLTR